MTNKPWGWIPSLYFAEGLPYIIVMSLSVIMYKRLGISNTDIALYTSWLYLPWVIKPFWSPIVDSFASKRIWIVATQLLIGAGLGGVAFTIPMDGFFQLSLALFWLMAFSSATHDIAADGFYMLALSKHQQTWFVGVRSTFYRFAVIAGQGLLIIFAGFVESETGLEPVTLEVNTKMEAPLVNEIFADGALLEPTQLELSQLESSNLEQDITLYPNNLEIGIASSQKPSSLLADARAWNTTHHFTQDMSNTDLDTTNETLGMVYIKLKQAPGEDETVTTTITHSGDKSIRIISAEQLRFTRNNWQTPAIIVVALDPKLKTTTQATFTVRAGDITLAWSLTLYLASGLFLLLFMYHFFALPLPAQDGRNENQTLPQVFNTTIRVFVSFFRKENILSMLAFLLFYRFSEAQLVKLAAPFLLDNHRAGGLQLTTGEVGFVYGTIGVLCLTLGGLCGGFLAAKVGLKKCLWPMAIAINIPNAAYLALSFAQPESLMAINIAIAVEQFGYGFGFTAYMLYMIYIAEGDHKTAHFAIGTGFMALGMMVPGMFSGKVQELLGYHDFFIWILIASIPSLIATAFIKVDPLFGIEQEK